MARNISLGHDPAALAGFIDDGETTDLVLFHLFAAFSHARINGHGDGGR
jgi:hypothetical protein